MSIADRIFKKNCKTILSYYDKVPSRAIWPDTKEQAYTLKTFGIVNTYNLKKEFPALTLRKTSIKTAFDELLWIWQKKSNNINDLNSHIWDQWTDSSGSIGKAYGYQMRQKYYHHKVTKEQLREFICHSIQNYPSAEIEILNNEIYVKLDQTDAILWDLSNNPLSRRIMTNIYNFSDLYEMNLYPCAYSMTFNCTTGKNNQLVLNGILNQRSQDMLVANNWNVCQYSLLIIMLAQCCNMIPGKLVHVISDCHIYDRHVSIIKDLIKREEYPAPKVWFDYNIKNFYEFTPNHLHIEDYITGEQITNIPVAV